MVVTKWTETEATQEDDKHVVAKILKEDISTRYGCPKELVSDCGTHLVNNVI